MSLFKEVGEVVKTVARSAMVAVGTKKAVVAIEKGLPNFSAKSKLIWEKVKSTKATGKQKVDWIDEADVKEEEIPDGFDVAKVSSSRPVAFAPAVETETEPETDVSVNNDNKE